MNPNLVKRLNAKAKRLKKAAEKSNKNQLRAFQREFKNAERIAFEAELEAAK